MAKPRETGFGTLGDLFRDKLNVRPVPTADSNALSTPAHASPGTPPTIPSPLSPGSLLGAPSGIHHAPRKNDHPRQGTADSSAVPLQLGAAESPPISSATGSRVAPRGGHDTGAAAARGSPGRKPERRGEEPTGATGFARRLNASLGTVQRFPRVAATTTVCIGLDFGTSCTKLVIAAPNLRDSPVYAVPLRRNRREYVTRSEVFWNGREYALEGDAPARLRDLKSQLLQAGRNAQPSEETMRAVVAYFGLVLRDARRWFLDDMLRHLAEVRVRWTLLLGIPAANWEGFDTARHFERALRAGWLASVVTDPITPQLVDECLAHTYLLTGGESPWDCDIGFVPEVAAAALAYDQSEARRPGLHLMLDVGAGTLDACAFVLPERGRLNFLLATVEPLGVSHLSAARAAALSEAARAEFRRILLEHDPLTPLELSLSDYAAKANIVSLASKAETEFVGRVVDVIRRFIVLLKTKRDPMSPAWRDAVPLFLCGGGSRVPLYATAVQKGSETAMSLLPRQEKRHGSLVSHDFKGLRRMTLPRPKFSQAPGVDFERMAVAWGLAREPMNLERICTPAEIPDIAPPRRRGESSYIGPEQT